MFFTKPESTVTVPTSTATWIVVVSDIHRSSQSRRCEAVERDLEALVDWQAETAADLEQDP
jgi:hypothetical protein